MCSETQLYEVFSHHGAAAGHYEIGWFQNACPSLWLHTISACVPAHFAQFFGIFLWMEMRVLMTNYFDDFISLSPAQESSTVTSCVHMCFKLLGWAFAETGEKAPDFAAVFHALGVSGSVRELHLGLVRSCKHRQPSQLSPSAWRSRMRWGCVGGCSSPQGICLDGLQEVVWRQSPIMRILHQQTQ